MKIQKGDIVKSKNPNYFSCDGSTWFDSTGHIGEVIDVFDKELYVNPKTLMHNTDEQYLNKCAAVKFENGLILGKVIAELEIIKKKREHKLKRILK